MNRTKQDDDDQWLLIFLVAGTVIIIWLERTLIFYVKKRRSMVRWIAFTFTIITTKAYRKCSETTIIRNIHATNSENRNK